MTKSVAGVSAEPRPPPPEGAPEFAHFGYRSYGDLRATAVGPAPVAVDDWCPEAQSDE